MTEATFDLYWLVTAAASRGKGLGGQLLAAVEQELTHRGGRSPSGSRPPAWRGRAGRSAFISRPGTMWSVASPISTGRATTSSPWPSAWADGSPGPGPSPAGDRMPTHAPKRMPTAWLLALLLAAGAPALQAQARAPRPLPPPPIPTLGPVTVQDLTPDEARPPGVKLDEAALTAEARNTLAARRRVQDRRRPTPGPRCWPGCASRSAWRTWSAGDKGAARAALRLRIDTRPSEVAERRWNEDVQAGAESQYQVVDGEADPSGGPMFSKLVTRTAGRLLNDYRDPAEAVRRRPQGAAGRAAGRRRRPDDRGHPGRRRTQADQRGAPAAEAAGAPRRVRPRRRPGRAGRAARAQGGQRAGRAAFDARQARDAQDPRRHRRAGRPRGRRLPGLRGRRPRRSGDPADGQGEAKQRLHATGKSAGRRR